MEHLVTIQVIKTYYKFSQFINNTEANTNG